eukprot:TRINITY_DN4520_c0_g2_i1.p1 TRINITY_DN4520_c0_g2~~TRINITY_DN4520_c0_g2_i1.p1  ORF type:complete len:158 (-),score=4.72 TRINITY_DN4520_c0_g2_i1:187-660(-)
MRPVRMSIRTWRMPHLLGVARWHALGSAWVVVRPLRGSSSHFFKGILSFDRGTGAFSPFFRRTTEPFMPPESENVFSQHSNAISHALFTQSIKSLQKSSDCVFFNTLVSNHESSLLPGSGSVDQGESASGLDSEFGLRIGYVRGSDSGPHLIPLRGM